MSFKSVKAYNEERYGGVFTLRNDADYADVIFLYENEDDVLVADVHYLKSTDYSGYVHCCGRGCPACGKNIRVQNRIFIPLYNLTTERVEFWDRTIRFENQLHMDVFAKYPNPSEYVFRITRNGVARDINTTYSITAVGRNSQMPFADICVHNNISFPDYYRNIVREYSITEIGQLLSNFTGSHNAQPNNNGGLPEYTAVPRVTVPTIPAIETISKDDSSMETFSDADSNEFADIADEDTPF